MKIKSIGYIFAAWTAVGMSAPLSAQTMFHLGPFIGGGQTSDERTVRYANGLRAQLDHSILTYRSWTWHARVELQNSLINTSFNPNDEWRELTVRDYRLAALGFKASYHLASAGDHNSELYVASVFGPSVAKLNIDRSDPENDSYSQRQMRGVRGLYYGLEIGSHYFLEENFAITLAASLGHHDVDQSRAHGTNSGEIKEDGAIRLIAEDTDASDADLTDRLKQTLYTVSFGLSFKI